MVASNEPYACMYVCMYVCMSTCMSTPSRFLLRGAPDYSADTESEFHAEAHEQLRVKDLPRVLTRRLEVDSNAATLRLQGTEYTPLRWIRTRNLPAARHRKYLYTTAPHSAVVQLISLAKDSGVLN